MSFEKLTSCPICGCYTPVLSKQQQGKEVSELCSCPVHGIIRWRINMRSGIRKLERFGQSVPRARIAPQGTFWDRVDRWNDLKGSGGYNGLRRIPPKRREEPYKR